MYIFQVSLIWILLFLVWYFGLKTLTFFNYNRIFLIGSILSGLLIPLLAPLVVIDKPVVYQVMLGDPTYIEIFYNPVTSSEKADWFGIITTTSWFIYLAGCLFMALRLLNGLYKILSMYQKAEKIREGQCTFAYSEESHLPFSFFNVIFLSKRLDFSANIHKVILHEITHVKQWHSLDVLLIEIVQVFFWFNPILFFYKRALKNVHEYVADQEVVNQSELNEYLKLLVNVNSQDLQDHLVNSFFNSSIKNRIIMLHTKQSNPVKGARYAFILPMLGLFTFMFASDKMVDNSVRQKSDNVLNEVNNQKGDKALLSDERVDNEIIRYADEMPLYPGCEDFEGSVQDKYACANRRFIDYVIANSAMKSEAEIRNALNGTVQISLIVRKDGTIDNIKVESDFAKLGKTITESIQSLENTGIRFKAGRYKGKEVDVLMKFPFIIKNGSPANSFQKETIMPMSDKDGVYYFVDERPRFPGCEHVGGWSGLKEECSHIKMFLYLNAAVKTPVIKEGERWRKYVMVNTIITKTGKIVIKDNDGYPDDAFDLAAKKAILAMNDMPERWTPGKKDGIPVDVRTSISVYFDPPEKDLNKKKETLVVIDDKYIASTGQEDGPLTKVDPKSVKSMEILTLESEKLKYTGNPEKCSGIVLIQTFDPDKTIRAIKSLNAFEADSYGTEYIIDGKLSKKGVFDALSIDEISNIHVLSETSNGITIKRWVVETKYPQALTQALEMNVFPNPAPKNKVDLTIKSLDSYQPALLKVFDLNGKMLYTSQLKFEEGKAKTEINLSEKVVGSTSVMIMVEQGKEIMISKIVVE